MEKNMDYYSTWGLQYWDIILGGLASFWYVRLLLCSGSLVVVDKGKSSILVFCHVGHAGDIMEGALEFV